MGSSISEDQRINKNQNKNESKSRDTHMWCLINLTCTGDKLLLQFLCRCSGLMSGESVSDLQTLHNCSVCLQEDRILNVREAEEDIKCSAPYTPKCQGERVVRGNEK